MQALSQALKLDCQRLDTLSAFLQRNGQELDAVAGQQGYFATLPHEVMLAVLARLDPPDLARASRVNSTFAALSGDSSVWAAAYRRAWPLSLGFTSPWLRPATLDSSSPARPPPPVSWRWIVRQRARTERNWQAGAHVVTHEFSASAPLSDMAMNSRPTGGPRRALVGVSTYSGGPAVLYDLHSGARLREIGPPCAADGGNDDGPMGLAFIDDAALVTCGHRDGGLHLWDVEAGVCVRSCPEADANGVAAFEVSGGAASPLFVSLSGKRVEVYDARSVGRVMCLRGHRQLLVCAAARASKGGRIASGDMDGTVLYWDIRAAGGSGGGGPLGSAAYPRGLRSRVHAVAIDPRRDVVASSSGMGHLLLWDVDGYRAAGVGGPVGSPTSTAAAAGRVVDRVRTTVGSVCAFHPSMDAITAVRFRGLDHFVTAEAGGRVSLWHTRMLLDGEATNRQFVCSQEQVEPWNEVKFMACDDEHLVTGLTCGIVRVLSFYPSALDGSSSPPFTPSSPLLPSTTSSSQE